MCVQHKCSVLSSFPARFNAGRKKSCDGFSVGGDITCHCGFSQHGLFHRLQVTVDKELQPTNSNKGLGALDERIIILQLHDMAIGGICIARDGCLLWIRILEFSSDRVEVRSRNVEYRGSHHTS